MHEPRDEDLILFFYGEARNPEAIERRLEGSPELRARYEALQKTLEALPEPEVPELPEDYGQRVWHRLAPRLEETPQVRGFASWFRWAPSWRQFSLVTAMVGCLAVGFLIGRHGPGVQVPVPEDRLASKETVEGPEDDQTPRILLVAVGRHLERSEMLLVELVNAEDPGALGDELDRAHNLLGSNRLYRLAAQDQGEAGLAEVLEELERLLLELSHEPGELTSQELASLRRRIDDDGMLFRVRILGSRIQRNNRPSATPGEA